jgi:hypothetical protein
MMSLAQVTCAASSAARGHSHSRITRCPIQVEEDLRKYQELLRNDPFASPEDTPPAGEQCNRTISPHLTATRCPNCHRSRTLLPPVALTAPYHRTSLPLLPVPRGAGGKRHQGQPLAASSGGRTRQGTRQRQSVVRQHASAGHMRVASAVACL